MRWTVSIAALALSASACAPTWKSAPHDTRFQRSKDPALHAKPPSAPRSDWWYAATHSTIVPLAKTVSPARYVGWLLGGRDALDVNAHGEVPDSTWFENRIGRRSMTPAEVGRGHVSGVPADGPLRVLANKSEGVTPGLVVRDSEGVQWYIKFDPPAFPEMTTGAEIVGARLLWAAGYHVPEMMIRRPLTARFELAPGATTRDDYNRVIPLTEARLRGLLTQLNPYADGRVRALFSRKVPGHNIGPFSYRGFRPSDPNDRIPHERRRSLRGLWLLSAWLNNPDTSGENSLDTFIPVKDGLGYVRHYLLDFGDSLGAIGSGEKTLSQGHEAFLEWSTLLGRTFALGLLYPYWSEVRRSPYRAVGIFEAEVFDPGRWSPTYHNPAFDEATIEDSFWAASILVQFERKHVGAAVAEAKFSENGAAAYVVDVLMARRRKLLKYVFDRMLALGGFAMRGDALAAQDYEIRARLRRTRSIKYEVRWNRTRRGDHTLASGRLAIKSSDAVLDLSSALSKARRSSTFQSEPFVTVRLFGDGDRSDVEVHLRVTRRQALVVGVDRDP